MTNAAPHIRNGQLEPQPWREMEDKNPYGQGTYVFASWVMGDPMDIWEENEYPWLREGKALTREAVEGRGIPFLGLCQGYQPLADAVGGSCAVLDNRKSTLCQFNSPRLAQQASSSMIYHTCSIVCSGIVRS